MKSDVVFLDFSVSLAWHHEFWFGLALTSFWPEFVLVLEDAFVQPCVRISFWLEEFETAQPCANVWFGLRVDCLPVARA